MDHKLLDYEQEFLNSYALFKATLTSLKESQTQEDAEGRRREISKCTRLLASADTALRQLELEARMRGGGGNADCQEDYKSLYERSETYRRELQQAFLQLRDTRSAVERLLLLHQSNENLSVKPGSSLQRQRLLSAAEQAQKGLRTLESSRVLALETEVLGSSVVMELQSQRQTIQRTMSRTTTVRESLHDASATLQRIVRAAFRTKMLVYAVLVLVILALGFISVRKLVPTTSMRHAASPAEGAALKPTGAANINQNGGRDTKTSVSPPPLKKEEKQFSSTLIGKNEDDDLAATKMQKVHTESNHLAPPKRE